MATNGARAVARRQRLEARVEGVVQGVGFRPFVRNLACSMGLSGFVGNDALGVFIEVEGPPGDLAEFIDRLGQEAPPLAVVERVTQHSRPPQGGREFRIVHSQPGGERRALVPADTATCAQCLEELFDASDRRYLYPFINCTNCGPRFSIVTGVPYDRATTTMVDFPMCPACRREYEDPEDRRFHAQATCCPRCGPSLRLSGPGRQELGTPGGPVEGHLGGPLEGAALLLSQGATVAVKGLGGYHLAALAGNEKAVAALRAAKHREDKPFAVMVPNLAVARQLCLVDDAAAALLASPAAPIVLLDRSGGGGVAPSVAPGHPRLGLMLPYTPLHHLLARRLGQPFVLTSGNVSDEPIAYEDEDAFARLGPIADAFLWHDRRVHTRTDDSVTTVVHSRPVVVRRSRGYAPNPMPVAGGFVRPVLACGAELKSTFCLGKERRAFLSQHIGDLENYETLSSYRQSIEHFCRLFEIEPVVVAHDLHPEYLSTKYAMGLAQTSASGLELRGVQHHHAHIASCLADNGLGGPVIGVAFDGLGLGDDGTLWGGEILVADLAHYRRVGHLSRLPMPGGTAAIKQPWRMGVAYLECAFGGDVPPSLALAARHQQDWGPVAQLARTGLASPMTSSAGRLFDAVSVLVGGRDSINYEGQAAVELEALVDRAETSYHEVALLDGQDGQFELDGVGLFRLLAQDVAAGVAPGVVAARFHNSLARMVVAACRRARDLTGLGSVALSGGVFQNQVLTERVSSGLLAAGFSVLVHHRAPTNDGGVSLGQAMVVGAQEREAR